MTIIGQRIRTRREDQGLAQADVALALGVTPSLISRYENGTLIPPTIKLRSLARVLHCSVQYLTGETYEVGIASNLSKDKSLATALHAVIDRMTGQEQEYLARFIYYMMTDLSEDAQANHTLRRFIRDPDQEQSLDPEKEQK